MSSVVHPSILRFRRDLGELDLPNSIKIIEASDLSVVFSMTPAEGIFKELTMLLSLTAKNSYPFDPPKIICFQPIPYHPSIDDKGNVCLNILRLEWMPILNLNAVILSLLVMLSEDPSSIDSLNHEAANDWNSDKENYIRRARERFLLFTRRV